MRVREALDKLLESLPERRLHEILDFAQFLSCQEIDILWVLQ